MNYENKNKQDSIEMPNVQITPLLDLCLVLLLVFMAVAPSITNGIDVGLPKGGSSSASQAHEKMITITYTKEGKLFINDSVVSPDNLVNSVQQITNNDYAYTVFIKSDKYNSYGNVLKILNKIQNKGYTKTILVTK
ncbi:biopolymer transporter ExbD [Rickettsiales bacterium]|nr:biopolymer transporter ExbD [Rickettsiales bacterium]